MTLTQQIKECIDNYGWAQNGSSEKETALWELVKHIENLSHRVDRLETEIKNLKKAR